MFYSFWELGFRSQNVLQKIAINIMGGNNKIVVFSNLDVQSV